MGVYDLSLLNPREFEDLVNDLAEANYGCRVERFKPGKDQGVDGLFTVPKSGQRVIIQAKHFINSEFKKLLDVLKNGEYEKMSKISCERYSLWTSISLSLKQKDTIKNLFSPFIKSTEDIFGYNEIESLISKNRSVEQKYYKLWLKSTEILLQLLHNDIYVNSEAEVMSMREKARYYAQTDSFINAYNKLLSKRVAIIVGAPGVGKTSLAEQMCIAAMSNGYECIIVSQHINEGLKASKKKARQVFYYDDFLGSNYFNALGKNEDSDIIRFINMVRAEKKLFILTSRTNIIDQSYAMYQKFDHRIKDNEFIIKVDDFSNKDKANILYSMLWRSEISKHLFEVLLDMNVFNKIIQHKNFNPRILELLTNESFLKKSDGSSIEQNEFIPFILENLDRPFLAWDNAFTHQLDEPSRVLVMLVALAGIKMDEDWLRRAYAFYSENFLIAPQSHVSIDFDTIIRKLARSFINRFIDGNGVYYTPFNPSVTDYVISKIGSDIALWIKVLKTLNSFPSLELFKNAFKERGPFLSSVALGLLKNPRNSLEKFDPDYIARTALLLSEENFIELFNSDFYNKYLIELDSYCSDAKLTYILSFLKRILQCENISIAVDEHDIYCSLIEMCGVDEDFKLITELLHARSIYYENIKSKFHSALYVYWENNIDTFVSDDVFNYVTEYVEGEEDDSYRRIDVDYSQIAQDIMDETKDLYVPLSESDIEEIIELTDFEGIYNDAVREDASTGSGKVTSTDYSIDISDLQKLFTEKYC